MCVLRRVGVLLSLMWLLSNVVEVYLHFSYLYFPMTATAAYDTCSGDVPEFLC